MGQTRIALDPWGRLPIVEATLTFCDHALAAIAATQPGLPPLDNAVSFAFGAPVKYL